MSVQAIRLSKSKAIPGLVALVAVLVALAGFGGALSVMVRRLTGQEEYSPGFLIPLVVVWLLWTRRDALRASVGRPSWAGPVLTLLAMVMHSTGELSAIYILSQIGFIVG